MPPEEPGNLVAVDLQIEDEELLASGERIFSKDADWITVSWYAQTPPPGSLTVGQGVAFVYDKDHVRRRELPNAKIKKDSDGYHWRDTARGDGLMFILVLPEGQTIRDPNPWPVEVKSFGDRIALYWMPYGKRVEITWNLEAFDQALDDEVLRLNDLISKAEDVPRNVGVEFPQAPDDLLATLHMLLMAHFNKGELKTLCFYLSVDYDELGGERKSEKARELIEYLQRRQQISQLIQKGKQMRPKIMSWPEVI